MWDYYYELFIIVSNFVNFNDYDDDNDVIIIGKLLKNNILVVI